MLGQRIVTDTYSREEINDLEAVFDCCRRGNTCEWHTGLSRFVIGYNQAYNKSYRPLEFPDVQNRNSKQPEVLLEADGEPSIVIERKSIMTPDYARSHGNFHMLANYVNSLLAPQLSSGMYSLEVVDPVIGTRGKIEIRSIADHISRVVLSREQLWGYDDEASGTKPVPWCFYEEFSDGSSGTTSVRARVNTIVSSGPQTTVPDIETAITGYAIALEEGAAKAAKQLEGYNHCKKLLLLEFYGDYLSGPDVIDIIERSRIPNVVDQVWLAYKEWVSEDEYETCWLRVRPEGQIAR